MHHLHTAVFCDTNDMGIESLNEYFFPFDTYDVKAWILEKII